MAERLEIPESTVQELTHWYSENLIRNTPFLKGTFFGWLFGRFGQGAVTINKSVHLTGKPRDLDPTSRSGIVLLGHELYHVLQQQEMGWLGFLLRYLWLWRPWHVTQGRRHPLEEPAYARGDEIRETLPL